MSDLPTQSLFTKTRLQLSATIVALATIVMAMILPELSRGQIIAEERSAVDVAPLDAVTYRTIQWIRDQSGLDNVSLAMTDLDQATAEAVLARLLGWTELNTSRIDAARQRQAAAERDVRRLRRQINVGPFDDRTVARLRQMRDEALQAQEGVEILTREAANYALVEAEASKRRVLESIGNVGKAVSTSGLDAEVEAFWKARRVMTQTQTQTIPTDRASMNSLVEDYLRTARRRLPEILAAERRVLPAPPDVLRRYGSSPEAVEVPGSPATEGR